MILIYYLIYWLFVSKTKSVEGEYCDDSADCASGLRCVGGNQCVFINKVLSEPGEPCFSNSNCELGYLCINGRCGFLEENCSFQQFRQSIQSTQSNQFNEINNDQMIYEKNKNNYTPITLMNNDVKSYLHFENEYGEFRNDIAKSSIQQFRSLPNGYLEFYDPKTKKLSKVMMTSDRRLVATKRGGSLFKLINGQLINERNQQLHINSNDQAVFN